MFKVIGFCDVGYFCFRGVKVVDFIDNIIGGICFKGYYCFGGIYDLEKCFEGIYFNFIFNKNIFDC